mgnify:CR=1 FL=1
MVVRMRMATPLSKLRELSFDLVYVSASNARGYGLAGFSTPPPPPTHPLVWRYLETVEATSTQSFRILPAAQPKK